MDATNCNGRCRNYISVTPERKAPSYESLEFVCGSPRPATALPRTPGDPPTGKSSPVRKE